MTCPQTAGLLSIKVTKLFVSGFSLTPSGQSLNIHLANPSFSQLTSMHFYGWKRGLKTGSYYLRTKPSAQAIQFTIDANTLKRESFLTEPRM